MQQLREQLLQKDEQLQTVQREFQAEHERAESLEAEIERLRQQLAEVEERS